MYGVVDHTRVDTNPGAGGAFAPPTSWQGDTKAYIQLMRERHTTNQGIHQQIELTVWFDSRYQGPIGYIRPYAKIAKWIISDLQKRRVPA